MKELSIGQRISVCIYQIFLKFMWGLRKTFGIKTYGIGKVSTWLKFEFDFIFQGAKYRFVPAASRSYCLLPAGIPNEPETHLFLKNILDGKSNVIFIDVGASIGEFVIPMAHDSRIARVIAFEPHNISSAALSSSCEYAPDKVTVIKKGVSNQAGFASFDFSSFAPTAAGLRISENEAADKIEICTLDDVLVDIDSKSPVILLMDIEGGELSAINGGLNFIKKHKPLLIMEYNETTKKQFHFSEVEKLIGDIYIFKKLCSGSGLLADDLIDTWNIVCIPKSGFWRSVAES